jgi:hypothetical protein
MTGCRPAASESRKPLAPRNVTSAPIIHGAGHASRGHRNVERAEALDPGRAREFRANQ